MGRRPALAALAVAILAGLAIAPLPASAEVPHDNVWEFYDFALGGDYQLVEGNFSGSVADDIYLYSPTGTDYLWIGVDGVRGRPGFRQANPFQMGPGYTPLVGDFAGDERDDIVWYSGPGAASPNDWFWVSAPRTGGFESSTRALSVGPGYQPVVLRDEHVGGKDDILWYAPGAKADYRFVFREDRSGQAASRPLKIAGTYRLVVGDWDGDGYEDLVLYAPGAASDYRWRSTPSGTFTQTNLQVGGTYRPVRVYGDRDGIFWWGDGAGPEAYWRSNGSTFSSVAVENVPQGGIAVTGGIGSTIVVSPDDEDLFLTDDPPPTFYNLTGQQQRDQGPGVTPIVGDFDGDGYIDTFLYGLGSIPDQVWYADPDLGARAAPGGHPAVESLRVG